MTCNKPLQVRTANTEKPAPPVVEDLENTVYDPRIDAPKIEDKRTKTEILRDKWVEEERETVARRLAELDDPLTDEDMKPILEAMEDMKKAEPKKPHHKKPEPEPEKKSHHKKGKH